MGRGEEGEVPWSMRIFRGRVGGVSVDIVGVWLQEMGENVFGSFGLDMCMVERVGWFRLRSESGVPRFLDESLSSVRKGLTEHRKFGWWNSWLLCLRRFTGARTVWGRLCKTCSNYVHGFISVPRDRRSACLPSETP